jgi:hypothetical protein
MPTATMTKSKPRSITITRAEGRTFECITVTLTGQDCMDQAVRKLRDWAGTAPDLGYHKCDFKIEFDDGETFKGRYDLHRPEDTETTLREQVQASFDMAMGKRPKGMPVDRFERLMRLPWMREGNAELRPFVETHEI